MWNNDVYYMYLPKSICNSIEVVALRMSYMILVGGEKWAQKDEMMMRYIIMTHRHHMYRKASVYFLLTTDPLRKPLVL